MNPRPTPALDSFAFPLRPASVLALLAAGLLLAVALLTAGPARAAVGVEKTSRHAGTAGETVDLTLGCGFCFPPCHGPHGQPDRTCMPGKALPPDSFPISLVPIEKVPKPYPCGPNALCSPSVAGAPRRSPYSYLGLAKPPDNGEGKIPRYRLHFEIPDLRPGVYTFVIFCDACARGKSGSLIADPRARPWRLRVQPSVG